MLPRPTHELLCPTHHPGESGYLSGAPARIEEDQRAGLSERPPLDGQAKIRRPALASDKRYADVLRGYLRAETIGPLPFRRLATAHPQTADAVFGKILGQPHFSWAEHGEALLRRRKPWYDEREPHPDITVIGARLSELIGR